jgi:hypothetical protein
MRRRRSEASRQVWSRKADLNWGAQGESLANQILGGLPRGGYRLTIFLVVDCVGLVRPGVFLIPHRICEDRMLMVDLIQGMKK